MEAHVIFSPHWVILKIHSLHHILYFQNKGGGRLDHETT